MEQEKKGVQLKTEKLEAQLKEWGFDIERLKDRANRAKVDAKAELDREVSALRVKLNEGQKKLAVQTILVEPVRRLVRCRHNHHAARPQGLKQAAKDRRIGNIHHLHFIQPEQLGFARNAFGNASDHIIGFDLGPRAMNFLHESVEMHAPLGLGPRLGKKPIHQHGLASANWAPDIDSLWPRLFLAPKETRQEPAALCSVQRTCQ